MVKRYTLTCWTLDINTSTKTVAQAFDDEFTPVLEIVNLEWILVSSRWFSNLDETMVRNQECKVGPASGLELINVWLPGFLHGVRDLAEQCGSAAKLSVCAAGSLYPTSRSTLASVFYVWGKTGSRGMARDASFSTTSARRSGVLRPAAPDRFREGR